MCHARFLTQPKGHISVSIHCNNDYIKVCVAYATLYWQLPPLQDDGPASDFYGKFSDRERSNRRNPRDGRGGFRSSRGWDGGRGSDDEFGDSSRRGGRSYNRSGSSWSKPERSGRDDWLIGGRRTSRSPSSSDRL